MKKHRINLVLGLFLTFLLIAGNTFAEDKLIVSILYGQVYASNEGDKKSEKRKLSPGEELFEKDIIHLLDDNAYIVLNSASGGNPLELKVKGDYKVKDMIEHFKLSNADFLKIYWEMVVKKMKQSISGFPGGPERSITFISSDNKEDPIKVISPITTKVLYARLNLIWQKNDSSNSYLISIKKANGDLIMEYRTCDTFAVIDLTSKELSPNICYYWIVKSATYNHIQSQQYCFLLLPTNVSNLLNDELSKIQKIYNQDKSPLKNVILAQFYESFGLLMDAYWNYQEALALSPNIAEYKNLFEQFCLRTGIK